MEVTSVAQSSNLVDPLIDDFPVSFFPRAINFSTLTNSPIFKTLYKARVSSSPDKLLKQGKTILEGSMDYLVTDQTKVVNTENEKGRKERRPGLGIPQAKFTMKPVPSQPDESLESSFDLSKTDPVEFFADFERKEKARIEVRKLKGQPLYDFDPNQPLAPRPRRPSLLGSTATYKHRPYPRFTLAKETLDMDVSSPTPDDVLRDSSVMHSPSVEASDSKSQTSESTKLCDLLPLVEGLDEDGVQNLLQERLNIEDVDIGTIVLPEWRVPLPDSVFNRSGASKATRNRKQASPGKFKSPLAFISSLNRHIAKRTPSRDSFSPLNIDSSPAEAIDPSTKHERRVDLVRQSGEDSFVSVVNERSLVSNPREGGVTGQVAQIGSTMNSLENLPEHGEERISVSDEDSLLSPSMAGGPNSEPKIQEDEVAAAQFPVQKLNFEGLVVENSSSYGVEGGMPEPSNEESIPVEEPAKEPKRASKRRIEETGELEVPSEAVISEEIVKERAATKTSESETLVSEETRSNKRMKVGGAQRGRKKGDKQLRRFSLFDAGTKWEAGVRRSSRIRMRPLQFWKGERFLYGRVNESLATVIGVKYASPSKDTEEPEIKVKSFVSDQHKDLLKFYSLY